MTNNSEYLIGLDIGCSSIKAVVGELGRDGRVTLVKAIKSPMRGMKRGMIEDVKEATGAVNVFLSSIRRDFPLSLKNIYLNTGTAQARGQMSRGIVAVSRADDEVSRYDTIEVVRASQEIKLPSNRMVIHAVTREYIVDEVSGIKNPVGMIGKRLEANVMLIDVFSPAIKSLEKVIKDNGGETKGMVFGPLASSRSVLNKNQKELGVALIDIGFSTTSLTVFEDGSLLHTAVFPFGSSHITNDLAVGLKISPEAAEAIKFSFGAALAKEMPPREMIDLKKIDSRAKGSVTRRFVAEIIEARLVEMLQVIGDDLRRINRFGKLPAGIVLVGGGAKLPNLCDLVKQELHLAADLGSADLSLTNLKDNNLSIEADDPEWTSALGLVFLGGDNKGEEGAYKKEFPAFFKKIWSYFKP
jgi:cell division protein FtsA